MQGIRFYRICLFASLLRLASPCLADSAYLHPESVYLGDVTELVIEHDSGFASLYPLDSSGLETDFEILAKKSKVFRLAGANQVTHRMQWRLQLLPRRSGKLRLPIIKIGDRSTPVLTLEVVPVPPSLQSTHDVYLQMEAATSTPYIGQQTQIDIRLYHNTAIGESRLLEPASDPALLRHEVEDRSYEVIVKGQKFQVTERNFNLFPRAKGELKLAPATYIGRLEDRTGNPQPGAVTGPRKIVRRSAPLILQVRAPPAGYAGRFWLPASHLEMSRSWNQSGNEISVGESLEWTLTITARGLPAESLPQDLPLRAAENLRIYADQPARSNHFEGRQLIGRLDQRFVVIASQPGRIVIPEVILKWWDVGSDSERQTRLAGRIIEVAGGTTPLRGSADAVRSPVDAFWPQAGAAGGSWFTPLISLLLLAAVITAIARLKSRVADPLGRVLRRRRLNRRLQRHCRANDAFAARGALIDWARERWRGQTINGLHQIDRNIISARLSAELEYLDAALYSRHRAEWRGQALWQQIVAENRRPGAAPKPAHADLPPLYPALPA